MSGLQKYLDQLTPNKSSGAVAITVRMALLDRNVYFYGQLAAHPLVASTIGAAAGASAEHQMLFRTLKLVTYGVWRDLAIAANADVAAFITATPELLCKLRILTLLTVAEASKSVPYATLAAELGIDAASPEFARDVEDVVIDATTAGMLSVTLHPSRRVVQVHDAAARDVHPSEVPALLAVFESWGKRCEAVVGQLTAAHRRVDEHERDEVARIMTMSHTEDVQRKKALRALAESGAQMQ